MTKLEQSIFLCTLLFSLTACDSGIEEDPIVCPAVALPAISVKVFDAETTQSASNNTTVTVTDSSFSDNQSCPNSVFPNCGDENSDFSFQLAFEREGTYSVTVEKAGYETWSMQDIVVTKGQCNVETVFIEANLNRQTANVTSDTATSQNVLESKLFITDAFEQVENVFSSGEDIIMNLTLENVSTQDALLVFNSGQTFDFVLKNTQDSIIWQWSNDKFFTQAIEEVDLTSNEILFRQVMWNQKIDTNNDGVIDATDELLPVGEYVLEGHFTYANFERVTVSREITIN